MTLINFTSLFGGINPLQNTYVTPVNHRDSEKIGSAFNFGFKGSQDTYTTNPTGVEFQDKSRITLLARSNPRIMELLKEYKIPLQVNMEALESLRKGHLATTLSVAAKICSALPKNLKREVNYSDIQQAAKLHDYGKILIPKGILNKEEAFTPEEKKVMELHSELGYELLKSQGVSENVLRLVKYHHQKPDGTGYPAAGEDFEYNLDSQILAAADKYSALTEDRCYHDADTKDEALEKIYKDVESGLISQEVFDALAEAVNR